MAHQFSDDERKRLAKQGKAMPDGGYPIRNREDLVNAVRAYGRGNNKEEVKKWIKKRAKELDAEQYLPDNWQVDDEDALAHHGIKGMKWGVRRYQRKDGSLTSAGKTRYKSQGERLKSNDKDRYDRVQRYRQYKVDNAPTSKESPRGANKGYWQKAPTSVVSRSMDREEHEIAKKTKKNAKNYSKEVKAVKAAYAKARSRGIQPGTVVRGRHQVEIMMEKDGGALWTKSGKYLREMTPDELIDAIYYLDFGEIPYNWD